MVNTCTPLITYVDILAYNYILLGVGVQYCYFNLSTYKVKYKYRCKYSSMKIISYVAYHRFNLHRQPESFILRSQYGILTFIRVRLQMVGLYHVR